MDDMQKRTEELNRIVDEETFRITITDIDNERTEYFDFDFWQSLDCFVLLEYAIEQLSKRNGVEYEGFCECVGISPLRDFWFKGESFDSSGFVYSDLAMAFTSHYIKTRENMLSRSPKAKLKETITFDEVIDNFRKHEIEEKWRLEAA